jgi:hypothetical protein
VPATVRIATFNIQELSTARPDVLPLNTRFARIVRFALARWPGDSAIFHSRSRGRLSA